MKKFIFLSVMITFLMASCASEKTTRFTIASQQGDCVGVAPQKCLFVKKGDATDWEFFYSNIEGFEYQEGFEYVLDIKEEPVTNAPADASSIKYVLAKEVSKTAKASEGLPQPIVIEKNNSVDCLGKVISVSTVDIGTGAAAGKVKATVVEVEVIESGDEALKKGEKIHCELVANPTVMPKKGEQYLFVAKDKHPAHAKGIYLLETNVTTPGVE